MRRRSRRADRCRWRPARGRLHRAVLPGRESVRGLVVHLQVAADALDADVRREHHLESGDEDEQGNEAETGTDDHPRARAAHATNVMAVTARRVVPRSRIVARSARYSSTDRADGSWACDIRRILARYDADLPIHMDSDIRRQSGDRMQVAPVGTRLARNSVCIVRLRDKRRCEPLARGSCSVRNDCPASWSPPCCSTACRGPHRGGVALASAQTTPRPPARPPSRPALRAKKPTTGEPSRRAPRAPPRPVRAPPPRAASSRTR